MNLIFAALMVLLFLFLPKRKSSKKKRAFFAKGSAGKKRLYAVVAPLCSAGWRWFYAYRLLQLGIESKSASMVLLSFSLSSLRRKKAPLGAELGEYYLAA
ncbi:MAG: hypothetical protein V4649_03320 [Bacteroidota bacterium]